MRQWRKEYEKVSVFIRWMKSLLVELAPDLILTQKLVSGVRTLGQ